MHKLSACMLMQMPKLHAYICLLLVFRSILQRHFSRSAEQPLHYINLFKLAIDWSGICSGHKCRYTHESGWLRWTKRLSVHELVAYMAYMRHTCMCVWVCVLRFIHGCWTGNLRVATLFRVYAASISIYTFVCIYIYMDLCV